MLTLNILIIMNDIIKLLLLIVNYNNNIINKHTKPVKNYCFNLFKHIEQTLRIKKSFDYQ